MASIVYDGTPLAADFTAGDSFRDHVGNGLFRNATYSASGFTLQNLLALQGDSDGDKDVDIMDFNNLAANFDPSGANGPYDWTAADFDGDNDVDITDFNALSAHFAPGGYAPVGSPVPEPNTWPWLALAAMAMMFLYGGRIGYAGTR